MKKTAVAIIGAGPSGLLLAHSLHAAGIDCIVVERQTRERVEMRIRAGLLEGTTVAFVDELGLGKRMHAEGIVDSGLHLADGNAMFRIDFRGLTGKQMLFYGQTELTKDLNFHAIERGVRVHWGASDVRLHGVDGRDPAVQFTLHGKPVSFDADIVVGCDGYHGPSRALAAATTGLPLERTYPFGWLGILSDVPPCTFENIYANGERGFALATLRSTTRSRYYVQVPLEDRLEDWPDERLWDEVEMRLGSLVDRPITRGPALEKSIAPLRSYVSTSLNVGRLFLVGDAAHIVPPTGAKGLNLAVSDVAYLSRGLIDWFVRGDDHALQRYSATALRRVWRAQQFSWYMTSLLHHFPEHSAFDRRLQLTELDALRTSEVRQRALAEDYTGLPL